MAVSDEVTKQCKNCSAQFLVRKEDLSFYKRISPVIAEKTLEIPPPTLCPTCRWQRRLACRNERTLFRRKCDLSGKTMISMHPADTIFPVYYITDWLSDKWDACDYGRDFDFSRPFFEQFKELCDEVPHFSLFVDPLMDENSEYTNCASESKNCYLISQAERNEDCYFSRGINNCKDCCDCLRINDCELCYEGINLSNCYHCFYSQDCENCSDCFFSTDLRGCSYCFGCHGLAQKEYYIFNEPVSKDEWSEKISSLRYTPELIAKLQTQSEELQRKAPKRFGRIIQCQEATGDHLNHCRDAKHCFDSKDLEHCAYCYEVLGGAKYSYDYSMWGIDCELLYECAGCGYNVYNCVFSSHCWNNVSNLIYCESCFPSVKHCFGSYGLNHKEYCVLNKQYTKAEYEKLVLQINKHMQQTGEWGEFFPIEISHFGYNETLAGESFPLPKEEVLKRGWNWRDKTTTEHTTSNVDIPESIEEVDDSICNQVLSCESTGKAYKVIKQELSLLKRLGLPIPRKAPEVRHSERVMKRNPRFLWNRKCDKCAKDIETTYAPKRPDTVYCEACYLETIY